MTRARPRLPVIAALLALSLAAPAVAGAAYDPKLTIALDPATPGANTALTSTVTQAGGETPSKKVVLTLPAAFGPASGTILTPCKDEEKAARRCPESSRMGTVLAQTMAGTFSGTVNYGPVNDRGIRFFIFLSNGITLLDQTIEGVIVVTPNGFQTILDGLPDVATTSFELKLAGPPRSLLKTPRECGTYVFKAAFTSQKDEQAAQSVPVDVAPCRNKPPRVDEVTGRKGLVRFTLSKPAPGSVEVKRGTKVLVRKSFAGTAGRNRVEVTRKLKRGTYRVVVRATDPAGARGIASGTLTVR